VGQAPAIPRGLWDYSDRTTGTSDELTTLVRNVLVPAIGDYRANPPQGGAYAFTSEPGIDLVGRPAVRADPGEGARRLGAGGRRGVLCGQPLGRAVVG
jgi:hypothetical protein